MVRSRHAGGARVRETHSNSGLDFAGRVFPEYGSWMTLSEPGMPDNPIAPGTVDEGNIVPGGLPGTVITDGTLPPTVFDQTPPPLPGNITVSSEAIDDGNGGRVVAIIVSFTPVDILTTPDFFATYVEATAQYTGEPAAPVWDRPMISLVGPSISQCVITGVAGNRDHWVRLQCVDVQGNRSAYSADYYVLTAADTEAPGVPQNLRVSGGFRGIGASWDRSSESDLMFYQLRIAPDDGAGAPDTAIWEYFNFRSNTMWIDERTPGVTYWVQVRAVDYSNNVATSDIDPTAVHYLTEPEAGWTTALSAVASNIGAADFAANSLIANAIYTGYLDAGTIKTGLLKVNTVAEADAADGIQIEYSGRVVGDWDNTGLRVRSKTSGRQTLDYIQINDAELAVYKDGVRTSAITPEGVDATAVNFGRAHGGHNLLLNSSFELADFTAAASGVTWDASADFTTGKQSGANDAYTDDFHLSAYTYA